MLSYAEYVVESGNSTVPYLWFNPAGRTVYAEFTVNGKRYRTYFAPVGVRAQHSTKDQAWTVDFEYLPWDNELGGRFDNTGTGDEFAVFGTVHKQTLEFIKSHSPSELHFTTDDPGRQRLYAKFTQRLAAETGYKVKKITDGIFVIGKK